MNGTRRYTTQRTCTEHTTHMKRSTHSHSDRADRNAAILWKANLTWASCDEICDVATVCGSYLALINSSVFQLGCKRCHTHFQKEKNKNTYINPFLANSKKKNLFKKSYLFWILASTLNLKKNVCVCYWNLDAYKKEKSWNCTTKNNEWNVWQHKTKKCI